MRGYELKQALAAGKRVYGTGMEGLGQARWPKRFAGTGLDWVFLDTEHTPQNRERIAWAAQLYAAYDIAPLVRIPDLTPSWASMVLDAGADGVVAPYVESVEQVKGLVGAAKYRPMKGANLQRALDEGVFPNDETREYLENLNQQNVLVIMIESPAGVDNLDAMLTYGGVDAVLIGPHDLSVSYGVPEQYDDPKFVDAVDRIVDVSRSHNVGVGMHHIAGSLDYIVNWAETRFNFVLVRTDSSFVDRSLRTELTELRNRLDGASLSAASVDKIGAGGHAE
jgi:4-hydroxy-2-oxoheptanedioate aldolase